MGNDESNGFTPTDWMGNVGWFDFGSGSGVRIQYLEMMMNIQLFLFLFFFSFFVDPQEIGIQPYRKVAVVEQFFDIIYNVHVGLGGRSGRHAGQKRTYRTVNKNSISLRHTLYTLFVSEIGSVKKT